PGAGARGNGLRRADGLLPLRLRPRRRALDALLRRRLQPGGTGPGAPEQGNDPMTAAYRKDGFVVLKGLVAEAALDACEAEFRAVFEAAAARFGIGPAAGPRPADLTPVMTALFRADMAAYLAAAK